MARKKPFISYWQVFAVILLLSFIAMIMPLFPIPLALIIGLVFIIVAKRKGWLIPFRFFVDLPLMFLAVLMFLFVTIGVGIYAFNAIPFWKILVFGIFIDALGMIGLFPIVGDIISAIIAFITAIMFFGGVPGIIIGGLSGILLLIPGPSMLFVTIALTVLWGLSNFIGNIIGGVI